MEIIQLAIRINSGERLYIATMRRYIKIFIGIILALLVISAGFAAVVLSSGVLKAPPKYVFLFIGDGMSYPEITMTSLYKTSVLKENDLCMNSFKTIGNAYTPSGNSIITDSAAAVSAMASGINTNNGYLNIDKDGNKYETIAEKLKKQLGYKIGIISSDNLNHATPAGFYAHQSSRYNGGDICLELVKSGFDYFGGSDILNQPADFSDILKENGYKYINTQKDIDNLTSASSDGKVIAISPVLDGYGTIPYKIDAEKYASSYNIAQHTKKCMDFLYDGGENNFFMMVEGGKIDWAGHSNDAATDIYEVIDFDNAVREAMNFYEEHPKDTLIIVTADHETGGLSIGYSATTTNVYLDYLSNQKISFSEFSLKMYGYRQSKTPFDDILKDVQKYFGISKWDGTQTSGFYLNSDDITKLQEAYDMSMIDPSVRAFSMSEYVSYGFYDPFTTTLIKIIDQKAGISWSTYSHTALTVPVLALGNGEENFTGFYRNSEIFVKLKNLMKVQ
ncbi:MAG: alkaline phosphatase [Oscillospiraceae bacterium]|nr:alkaline phosphatase [Oscillospiraceae bacterium]